MVLDKIENVTRESLERLKNQLRELGMSAILPDEVVALVTGIVLDKMSYSHEVDLVDFAHQTSPAEAEQLEADLKRLPAGMLMMVCPGGDRSCGNDIMRTLRASATVPGPLRERMDRAIQHWRDEMDAIAQEASEGGVPVVVRYDLTPNGPELALGYGREGHHGVHTETAEATSVLTHHE